MICSEKPARARVVELVDAPDSKSGTERCVGSIPTSGTNIGIVLFARFRNYYLTVFLEE